MNGNNDNPLRQTHNKIFRARIHGREELKTLNETGGVRDTSSAEETVTLAVCKTGGEILHNMEEVKAICGICHEPLCAKHSKHSCSRCGKTLCYDHGYVNRRGEISCRTDNPLYWFPSTLEE